jgi:hypothetical protein
MPQVKKSASASKVYSIAPRPGVTKPPAKDAPPFLRLFETFGIEFGKVNGSGEAVAEACPWCGNDRFHLQVATGLYHCKHCEEGRGNVTQFLTWYHGRCLEATTPEHFGRLGQQRGGIAPQTLRRHELAYDAAGRCWLVPFKSSQGSVVNLQLYYPGRGKPDKVNLPGLPTCLYGFHELAAAPKDRLVFLCEGPFDAVAADYAAASNHRGRYVFVATPGAFFKTEWVEHFRGYKVRALCDNDEAGRRQGERVQKVLGESGVAAELLVLRWPDGTPDGYDVNDFRAGQPQGRPRELRAGPLLPGRPQTDAGLGARLGAGVRPAGGH